MWRLTRNPNAFPSDSGWWTYVTAQNVGDGTAYGARLVVKDGTSVENVQVRSRSGVLASGESLITSVRIDMQATVEENAYGSPLTRPLSSQEVGRVRVTVMWNHPPHRWRTRKRSWRVARMDGES